MPTERKTYSFHGLELSELTFGKKRLSLWRGLHRSAPLPVFSLMKGDDLTQEVWRTVVEVNLLLSDSLSS